MSVKMCEFFKHRQKELGITYASLGKRMGTGESYVGAILNGKKAIGESTFRKLCAALELEEAKVRKKYNDQIAMVVCGKHRKTVKTADEKARDPFDLTGKEIDEPTELAINALHTFVCDLNDDGRRVAMYMMRMLASEEHYKRNREDHNGEHEDEIQN